MRKRHNNSQIPKSRKKYRLTGQKIKIPNYSKINFRIVRELDHLLETISTRRLSQNLRNIFLLYLDSEKNILSSQFKEMPADLLFLFNFLDALSEELEQDHT